MNIIDNPNLSMKAKGLYYILSNSNLKLITQRGLKKTNKDGIGSIESGIRELKQAGLLRLTKLRNGRTHYHLKPVLDKRNVDMVRIVLRLFKDNGILLKPNRDVDDAILKLISRGHTVFEFIRATKTCVLVMNLGFSPSYLQDFRNGLRHVKPVVLSPTAYIFKIVKRSQTFENVMTLRSITEDYHDYNVEKLNHFHLGVLKSKLFKAYYPGHVETLTHP